jgi:hypothetical protein
MGWIKRTPKVHPAFGNTRIEPQEKTLAVELVAARKLGASASIGTRH